MAHIARTRTRAPAGRQHNGYMITVVLIIYQIEARPDLADAPPYTVQRLTRYIIAAHFMNLYVFAGQKVVENNSLTFFGN